MDPIGALDPLTNLLPDVLKPLGVLWFFWGLFVFWTLINPGEGRTRWLNYINGGLAANYRRRLRRFLGIMALHWFKDYWLTHDSRKQQRLNKGISSWFGIKIFTEPAFVFSLRLALVYPVFALLLFWGVSGQGEEIGNIEILPAGKMWWERWLFLFWLAIGCGSFYKSYAVKNWYRWIYGAVTVISLVIGMFNSYYFFAFALFSALPAVTIGGIFSITAIITLPVAFTISTTVFFFTFTDPTKPSIISLFAFIIANFLAFLVSTWHIKLIKKYIELDEIELFIKITNWFWVGFIMVYLSITSGLVYWLNQQHNVKTEGLILLLFYVLLPLLNVVWDWLSLGVTRSLLYAIADRVHSGWVAFGWAMLDGVLALGFLFLITLTVVVGVATTNWIAQLGGGCGSSVLDLQLLFDGLRINALHPDYWWLYFMFLYTLVPTIVHMVIASLSVLLWIPRHKLQEWTKDWKDEQHKFDFPKFALAGGYLAVVAPLAIIMPVALVLILIWLLFTLGGGYTFGTWLLDFLQTVASMIDASVIPSL